MGYYTRYSLTWEALNTSEEDRAAVTQAVSTWINSNEEANYALHEDGTPQALGKWYGCEDDLRALSASLPTVKFILEGFGEEAGDIWRAYAKAGRVEKVKAELKFRVPNFFKLNH